MTNYPEKPESPKMEQVVDNSESDRLRDELIAMQPSEMNYEAKVIEADRVLQLIQLHTATEVRKAELKNVTALRKYMTEESSTFADWLNYLSAREAALQQQLDPTNNKEGDKL